MAKTSKAERADERRREIEEAAYAVLSERGYKATSMLEIAKRANASNETLYRWYGNKQTLFASLVRKNAEDVVVRLQHAIATGRDPLSTLRQIAPLLVELVTSEKAIALNRAAAADVLESGTLGKTIAASGRESVVPLLSRIFADAHSMRLIEAARADEAASVFVGLLIGDLQIQRVIGVRKPLTKREIADRAERACNLTLRLFAKGGRTMDR